jgi:hypothetical protein
MRFADKHRIKGAPQSRTSTVAKLAKTAKPVSVFLLLAGSMVPASAASLSRSVEVNGTPAQVWSAIGPFCSIKDWHPAIGSCMEDGKTPPTRTLVTKDGKATFVEFQTAISQEKHLYGYTFVSSPLPVNDYKSILKVTAKGRDHSLVSWSGNYTPDAGKEKDANAALSGIYESGLDAIKAKFEK